MAGTGHVFCAHAYRMYGPFGARFEAHYPPSAAQQKQSHAAASMGAGSPGSGAPTLAPKRQRRNRSLLTVPRSTGSLPAECTVVRLTAYYISVLKLVFQERLVTCLRINASISRPVYVCAHVRVYVGMYMRMRVCMYIRKYTYIYVRM